MFSTYLGDLYASLENYCPRDLPLLMLVRVFLIAWCLGTMENAVIPLPIKMKIKSHALERYCADNPTTFFNSSKSK